MKSRFLVENKIQHDTIKKEIPSNVLDTSQKTAKEEQLSFEERVRDSIRISADADMNNERDSYEYLR